MVEGIFFLLIASYLSKKFRGCLCDNWKPSFLALLLLNWHTFSRQVSARSWREWVKNHVLTNQNSRNRGCQIVRRTIYFKQNNSIMYALVSYDVVLSQKKWKLKEVSAFSVKRQGFNFSCTSFRRNYVNIIPDLLDSLEKILLTFNHSALNRTKSFFVILSMPP